MSERRTYDIRLVTPAFAAGADRQRPEIRVPSIRGCLRWWWRLALKAEGRSLEAIRKDEADLFGSTGTGQRLVLRVTRVQEGRPEALQYRDLAPDHQYLWFPLRPEQGQSAPITRAAVPAGTEFRLEALIPSHLHDAAERIRKVDRAVTLWVLGGGLGLRSRRGAGSLWFASAPPSGRPAPEGKEAIERFLRAELAGLDRLFEFRVARSASPTWRDALSQAGSRYRGRRRWVRDTKGREALPALGWPILRFPAFRDDEVEVDGHEAKRLASPVWLKVIPDGRQFRWLLAVVKAPFAQEVRSGAGSKRLEEVVKNFADGFEDARPPAPGRRG